MSNTECHIEFDGRLWDVQRLLRSGQMERARVETALLMADAQAAGHDWVADELHRLWDGQEAARRTA
jgi:hypothetical protein